LALPLEYYKNITDIVRLLTRNARGVIIAYRCANTMKGTGALTLEKNKIHRRK
jgi:hypothetical protein